MSLYAMYLKEREDFEIVENEFGFASFKCSGEECYLRDIYVIPEKRRTRLCFDMADQVAQIGKAQGCKYMLGTVSPLDKNATRNIQVLINYGMRLVRSTSDILCFIKELN